jgi:protease I
MVLGAICIAPTILAKAGVLKGKQATVWDAKGEQIAILKAAGARYTGNEVTVDALLVTGNGPNAAEEFGRTFATLAG